MKIIIFSFKHRHRFKDLNNFLITKKYGQFLIINLSGPIRYILAKFLIKLKIGRGISCDGRPLIKNKKNGINFWMRGNILNIPEHLRKLNNNFTNIKNPITKNGKILQIYPINIIKTGIKKDIKIIFISNIKIKKNNEVNKIWNKNKRKFLNKFDLIDNISFWKNNISNKNDEYKFFIYKEIKSLLRLEIVKLLKKKFKNKMIIVGNDWKKFNINSLNNNYDSNFTKEMYNGNICLDTGSIEGSASLYPRSIQIIEAGGLILQAKQKDSNVIWNNLKKKILFNNIHEATNLIDEYIHNNILCKNIVNKININFNYSEKKIEKNLGKIFK